MVRIVTVLGLPSHLRANLHSTDRWSVSVEDVAVLRNGNDRQVFHIHIMPGDLPHCGESAFPFVDLLNSGCLLILTSDHHGTRAPSFQIDRQDFVAQIAVRLTVQVEIVHVLLDAVPDLERVVIVRVFLCI